jgi:hypothetical protein
MHWIGTEDRQPDFESISETSLVLVLRVTGWRRHSQSERSFPARRNPPGRCAEPS